jgi:vomeronasal1 receptor
LYAVLLLFPDISSLGVMIWASSFMVFILYRHRQKVQHIHKTNIFPRSFPESRATQRILILVNIFVSFTSSLPSSKSVFLILINQVGCW